MTPFKRIKCPIHQGVIVGQIEVEPDGEKAVVFWTRMVWDQDHVLGGRASEPENKTRLRLDDQRIRRGKIPYLVTWCRKCSREYVLPIDWVLDEAKHSGVTLAPAAVLDS